MIWRNITKRFAVYKRLVKLNQIAIQQMKVLEGDSNDRKKIRVNPCNLW